MLGLMLQWGAAGFQDLLQQLDNLGFFQYVLPFLLIFAVVYALLSQINIFKDNKGASLLIAVAIGLLALQLDFVSVFFQAFFPKVGIGLAVLLVAMILAGAFITDLTNKEVYKWIFFGVGAAIFFIILFLTLSGVNFVGSWWWNQYGALVIVAIVVITAMILVMTAKSEKK